MAFPLALRLKTGIFDEWHIDIINTFEMHLSLGNLFTRRKNMLDLLQGSKYCPGDHEAVKQTD